MIDYVSTNIKILKNIVDYIQKEISGDTRQHMEEFTKFVIIKVPNW